MIGHAHRANMMKICLTPDNQTKFRFNSLFNLLSAAFISLCLLHMNQSDAFAQSAWPSRKPITLVAVFPAGGSVDQVARIISQPLSQELGQTVIVDNKGGASGTIGTSFVTQSPPDGYTFAVVFDTHGVNSSIYPNLSYDAQKDLTPLILVGTSPMVLATYTGV